MQVQVVTVLHRLIMFSEMTDTNKEAVTGVGVEEINEDRRIIQEVEEILGVASTVEIVEAQITVMQSVPRVFVKLVVVVVMMVGAKNARITDYMVKEMKNLK